MDKWGWQMASAQPEDAEHCQEGKLLLSLKCHCPLLCWQGHRVTGSLVTQATVLVALALEQSCCWCCRASLSHLSEDDQSHPTWEGLQGLTSITFRVLAALAPAQKGCPEPWCSWGGAEGLGKLPWDGESQRNESWVGENCREMREKLCVWKGSCRAEQPQGLAGGSRKEEWERCSRGAAEQSFG